jgi:hypothetical protein
MLKDEKYYYTLYDSLDSDSYDLPIKGEEIIDTTDEREIDAYLNRHGYRRVYRCDKSNLPGFHAAYMVNKKDHRVRGRFLLLRMCGNYSNMFRGIIDCIKTDDELVKKGVVK